MIFLCRNDILNAKIIDSYVNAVVVVVVVVDV
jgi:hypothetical protein